MYEIGDRIGEGGVAEVFVATNPGAGVRRTVVVKRVKYELRDNAELKRAFAREASIAQRLHHGNVVAALDAGDDDGLPYLVLEHVDGVPLHELVYDGRGSCHALPAVIAVYVAEQIALALAYVHGLIADDGRPLGLVHRDVTPKNVLCSREGLVKLTDFGIAHTGTLGNDTLPGFIKGTPQYLAPEQAAGRPVDARADIFALGLVLRRMLVGDGPLDGVDAELHALVQHATEPAVRDRIASADAFVERLQAWRAKGHRSGGARELGELVRLRLGRPVREARSLDLGAVGAAGTRQLATPTRKAMRWSWIATGGLVVAAVAIAVAWSGPIASQAPPETVARIFTTPSLELPAQPPPVGIGLPAAPRPPPTPTTAPADRGVAIDESTMTSGKTPPRRQARGKLRINVLPYAEVRIDGRAVGRTPQTQWLPAGTHTIQLDNPDVPLHRTKTIRIVAGGETSVIEW